MSLSFLFLFLSVLRVIPLTGKTVYRVVHPSWVRTPLLDTVLSKGHITGLVLDATTVADVIVAQILKGESAQLILPSRLSFMAGIRGYPSWLQEWVRSSDGGSLVFMCPQG